MNVKERIAYVRGLIEGSEFHGRDERAQAIWTNLLSVCDSLADSVSSLWESVEDVEEYVEAIDLDLADLEDVVDEDEDGDSFVEVECDNCGEELYFEEDFLYDNAVELICPTCGAELSVADGHAVAQSKAAPPTIEAAEGPVV